MQEELLQTAEYESRLDLGECKCSLYRVGKLAAVCPPALPHDVKNIVIHLEKLIHKKINIDITKILSRFETYNEKRVILALLLNYLNQFPTQ